ncbi:MAG: nucleotidyltransferase family protein [Anaerofustis stercorihominis]|nr:nucleotidyltransferase family protein [Anaerofustis stercorihominis]
MRIASVIAEFNPLHNAHKYILEKTKESGHDITAVILGGNFMQRGEFSVLDCYDRAEAAVKCGADIVLLLPYVYSAQTAEVFAWGAAGIAEGIGTDTLFFGSEDDSLLFYDTARLLSEEPEEFRTILRDGLSSGLSFAASRENAVREILGESGAKCLMGANNILSTEYTKAIIRMNSQMKTKSVKRIPSLSATKIRQMLSSGKMDSVKEYVPEESFEMIKNGELHFSEDNKDLLFYGLLLKGEECLCRVAEVESGLERRMYAGRYSLAESLKAYEDKVSAKRYTRSRIRRILYNNVMGYTKEDLTKARSHMPKSALVLAVNSKGRDLIKAVNGKGDFRIISNLSKEYDSIGDDRWIYDMEIRAYEMYHRKDGRSLMKEHCRVLG